MAQHATLIERTVTPNGNVLKFEIEDDAAGNLGEVTVKDGALGAVKAALQQEAARLLALPIGLVIDL